MKAVQSSAAAHARRHKADVWFAAPDGRDRVLAIRGARGSDVALKHSASGIRKAMSDRLCALPARGFNPEQPAFSLVGTSRVGA
jgi:hypothetical protein